MDAISAVPGPVNEPVLSYAPGSPERQQLASALETIRSASPVDLALTIGGERVAGEGAPIEVVAPHRHAAVLGHTWNATTSQVGAAVDAALAARASWRALDFDERAAVFLKAADILTGPRRAQVNAATMLGQSKTCFQAEIDAACELADFWRFNVHFAQEIHRDQPRSSPGVWNRFDHRPLEGFVLAITPFNFTAIAGNLPTAPALMGACVVWKPSPTQALSAQVVLEVLEQAGLPPGVINLVTGDGHAVSEVALVHPDLAGIHFTGSTATFRRLWQSIGANLPAYRDYPRIVGETGGKDFVIAHPSADLDALRVGLIRGAFEYQGQKCSAASRAYLPESVWTTLRDDLLAQTDGLAMGDPCNFTNFLGAVIDRRAFDRHARVFEQARADASLSVLAGGTTEDTEGFFVRPTILLADDPGHEVFTTEFFGPILSVFVYPDADFEQMLATAATTSPYALTGAIFARDREAVATATEALRYAAGNFYINDKPTGAVVGQQPFGGARASGTDDKAGSAHNLLRWTSPRVIKETFVAPTDYRYPHMG
ncbi:MAG TPA: L-glutamate gamma-semialdehyde dehydrogenase [Mycobacteriales bacterium]|nr:L-glutamate gamma-semialdehyde dehydrogenase [Mycobacteriales bacterium]